VPHEQLGAACEGCWHGVLHCQWHHLMLSCTEEQRGGDAAGLLTLPPATMNLAASQPEMLEAWRLARMTC